MTSIILIVNRLYFMGAMLNVSYFFPNFMH